MSGASPAIDHTLRFHGNPFHVESLGVVANPLRRKLIDAGARIPLHHDGFLAQAVPIRLGKAVVLGDRNRQAEWQIVVRHQSAASEPKMIVLTGVTIGPEEASETFTSGTWLVDWPRICRTASICNSRPCM